jgi:hypothetical protein
MFRKITLLLLILALSVSFGYCASNNWGETDTNALLKKVSPSYILHSGVAFGGEASVASTLTTIPLTYSIVKYYESSSVGQACTLANGSPGQLLTVIMIVKTGSNTIVVTPATKTGYTTVTLDTALDFVTLLYVDSTVGWIVIGGNGTLA